MNETIDPGDLALVLVVVGFALLLRFILAVRRVSRQRRRAGSSRLLDAARSAFTANAFGPEAEWVRRRASASAVLGVLLVVGGLILAGVG